MVKRVFRQGPDHITVPLQPCKAVGEYQAQHSTGGLSEGWGLWKEGGCRAAARQLCVEERPRQRAQIR